MKWSTSIACLCIAYSTCVAALEKSSTVDILVWPISTTSTQSFAKVEYNRTNASVKSSQEPRLVATDEIVRVGYTHPESRQWSGIVTSTSNFASDKKKTILLHLDSDGELFHIGFRSRDTSSNTVKTGEVDVEIVVANSGPPMQMNKPVVLTAEGDVEKPPEKTFLQKYWWAIAIFLVVQVVLGGGSNEKKA